jgi:hypothetical protein
MVALSRCVVTSVPSCGAACVHRKVEASDLTATVDFSSHLIGWTTRACELRRPPLPWGSRTLPQATTRVAFNEGGIFRRCKALDN